MTKKKCFCNVFLLHFSVSATFSSFAMALGGKVTLSHGLSLTRIVLTLFVGSAFLLALASVDFLRHIVERRKEQLVRMGRTRDNQVEDNGDEEATWEKQVVNIPDGYLDNNWGENVHLLVKKDRQKDAASNASLKTILMWNDAYGVRQYDIGHGREPFFRYGCEETRCFATQDRFHLPSVDMFDALLIHQRGIDWKDMPDKRSPRQRWVHWNIESPQYLSVDIAQLNGMFNWTMTFKRTSDFYLPYGRVFKIREHPTGKALQSYIKEFGRKNRHLAGNRTELKAAWFVSHCATQARRERYAKMMRNYMEVDIYGKCGKLKCDRRNETACYINMEKEYKFYLSFENSLCDDYVTEKFFNIFSYNVIPITYSGANFDDLAPPHSSINALKFPSVRKLVNYLQELHEDDAKYAEYFWWRDFYEVRQGEFHRAQAYCDLCKRLNNPDEPPKVYDNLYKWWLTDSHCKKLRSSAFNQ